MRSGVSLCVLLLTLASCYWALENSEPGNSLPIGVRLVSEESNKKHESVSEVANWCLHIAEKRDIDSETRVAALCRIAELGERGTVPRLLKMLPGDYDVVTLEVINTLSSLKDPRAGPVLESILSGSEGHGIEVPGKIRAAAWIAFRACVDSRRGKEKTIERMGNQDGKNER
jgi:hypothetical protein